MSLRIERTLTRGMAATLLAATLLAGCAGNQPRPVAKEPAPKAEPAAATNYAIREEVKLSSEQQRDFNRAVQHLRAEEYDQAIALLTALTEQAKGNSAPYINLAMAYRKVEKLKEAEESLTKALEINPNHPVANNEYGMVLRRTGRFAEARAVYEKLLAKYPEFLPGHKNLGILCDLFIGDLECALEHYSVYSAAIPDDKDMTVWIADLQNRMGQ